MSRMGWTDRVSNAQIKNLVLGAGSENISSQRIKLSRLS